MAEMIDIYDKNRQKTGEVLPRKAKLQEGQYMLYALALIQDAKGKYLITQRAMTKKWAAGQWEIPGGGAKAGEDSYAALCREVKEETNLDASLGDCKVIYSYRNDDVESKDNYFVDIYLVQLDFDLSDVKFQEEETMGGRLASLEEIKQIHDEIGFLHYERICQALA